MRKLLFKICFTFIITGFIGVFYVKNSIESYANSPLNIKQQRELWVEPGASINGTLLKLQRQGVISDIWKLKLFVKLNPVYQKIQTGLYELHTGDTPLLIMQKLVEGDVKKFKLTLIEGHTLKEWKQTIKKAPRMVLPKDIFVKVLEKYGDTSGLPEGKFFPETYNYTSTTKVQTLLEQSYNHMAEELKRVWDQRDKSVAVNSSYELLILASIIEKETAKPEERNLISAVFNNRLKKRMRLQTDPTVIYGMGDRYQGNITKKDLRTKTPFNTYRIKGLPPTPIAAPSLASIVAAAHPADVGYLYFVSRNDGSHVFSKTLKAHNRAVNTYQRSKK
ncbi:endolytic transglycosylase MltG [Shewanella sp. 202IG2-18]|uniref:endolytic transglycosylase MltG n=1 Tax=Parashewanella hymeniacidonis TaxID=2807618 RepID=UPI00195FBFF3|nr:endolytic transglycosylase MltG [Parashewanella hymeniacidonis]MBM7074036.1 endolytic transglycosylase MltG [Parashewanella hymeniacidonis]